MLDKTCFWRKHLRPGNAIADRDGIARGFVDEAQLAISMLFEEFLIKGEMRPRKVEEPEGAPSGLLDGNRRLAQRRAVCARLHDVPRHQSPSLR